MLRETPRVITRLTPAHVNGLLYEKSWLASGEVCRLETRQRVETAASVIYFLEIGYAHAAPYGAPRRLFAKIPKMAGEHCSEVDFYNRIACCMSGPPVVRCLEAKDASGGEEACILLEDVSETHCRSLFPLPPRRREAELMIDALAVIHAYWWNHPQLVSTVGANDEVLVEQYIERYERQCGELFCALGDRVRAAQRRLCQVLFNKLPKAMSRRVCREENLTLLHRDSHSWNFLVPEAADGGGAYLIDWEAGDPPWRIGFGAGDVAYLMVHWWSRERRGQLERPLLTRYWSRLVEEGVDRYGWDDLWRDYCLGAMAVLMRPIHESNGGPAWSWYPQLERTLHALEDLQCLEVL